MTEPITITNQAALEQGQRVAREAKELPTERGVWRQGLTLVMVCQRGGDPKLRAVFPSGYECYVTGLTRGGWLEVDPSPLPREVSPAALSRVHELKCWPVYFAHILDGSKRFELRVNDREYRRGDVLFLREWNPDTGNYTGRDCRVLVTYICANEQWLASGVAAMSIEPLAALLPEIPPHIQFLRQLPAAKAGQSIEEAAAERIRELEAENARLKDEPCPLVHCHCSACGCAIEEGTGHCGCDDNRAHPIGRLSRSVRSKMQLEVAALTAERDALLSQLPDGMKHCTIQVKECENGHARLTATNWIDHGCHWCELAALAERERGMRDENARLATCIPDLVSRATTLSRIQEWAERATKGVMRKVSDTEYVIPCEDGFGVHEYVFPCSEDAALFDAARGQFGHSLHAPPALSPAPSPAQAGEDATGGDYPNIEACRDGRTSGGLNEWPVLRQECGQALAELATLRQQLTEADEQLAKLKTIVRERTHREQGCLCDRCLEDEYQTAEVVGKLRREAEAAKGALENSRKLVSNWRAGANCLSDADGDGVYREMYHRCASELEAALASTDSERSVT